MKLSRAFCATPLEIGPTTQEIEFMMINPSDQRALNLSSLTNNYKAILTGKNTKGSSTDGFEHGEREQGPVDNSRTRNYKSNGGTGARTIAEPKWGAAGFYPYPERSSTPVTQTTAYTSSYSSLSPSSSCGDRKDSIASSHFWCRPCNETSLQSLPPLPFRSSSKSNTSRGLTRVRPKQKSFRDVPEKKKLLKTEYCDKFPNVSACPHGDKCHFAHSEDELVLKTLLERRDAGVIKDIETYRTRPCFTFVSTGSW